MDSGGEKEEPNNGGAAVNVPVCPVSQVQQNGIEIERGANCQKHCYLGGVKRRVAEGEIESKVSVFERPLN